jgi:hypothetical protein
VQQHAQSFFAQSEEAAGARLPQFVRDEFDAFLECGILAHGFLRLRCGACGHDKLLAFSCKRRGFCPSCGARRMAQTTAHLVNHFIGARAGAAGGAARGHGPSAGWRWTQRRRGPGGLLKIIAAILERPVTEKIFAHPGWIRSRRPKVGCARRSCTSLLEPLTLSDTFRHGLPLPCSRRWRCALCRQAMGNIRVNPETGGQSCTP